MRLTSCGLGRRHGEKGGVKLPRISIHKVRPAGR